jgi:hypothetical protein
MEDTQRECLVNDVIVAINKCMEGPAKDRAAFDALRKTQAALVDSLVDEMAAEAPKLTP